MGGVVNLFQNQFMLRYAFSYLYNNEVKKNPSHQPGVSCDLKSDKILQPKTPF
jgi:hypothetical protein